MFGSAEVRVDSSIPGTELGRGSALGYVTQHPGHSQSLASAALIQLLGQQEAKGIKL